MLQRLQPLPRLPEKVQKLNTGTFALSSGCEVVRIMESARRLTSRRLTASEIREYIESDSIYPQDVYQEGVLLYREVWQHQCLVRRGGSNSIGFLVLSVDLVPLPHFKFIRRHQRYQCGSCEEMRPGKEFVWGYHLRLPLDVQYRDRKLHCATCAATMFTGQSAGHDSSILALAVIRGEDTAVPPLADELQEIGENTKSSALLAFYEQEIVLPYHTRRERIPKIWASQRYWF